MLSHGHDPHAVLVLHARPRGGVGSPGFTKTHGVFSQRSAGSGAGKISYGAGLGIPMFVPGYVGGGGGGAGPGGGGGGGGLNGDGGGLNVPSLHQPDSYPHVVCLPVAGYDDMQDVL